MPDTGSKALPGLTDLLVLYRQAARARSRWLLTFALLFLRGMVNEIVPASSARFSCTDIRSRNRSPPVELSTHPTTPGRRAPSQDSARRRPPRLADRSCCTGARAARVA